jgi:hypothetical protein
MAKRHLDQSRDPPEEEKLGQKAKVDRNKVVLLFETTLLSNAFSLEDPRVMLKLGLGMREMSDWGTPKLLLLMRLPLGVTQLTWKVRSFS